jgi:hypothetical protein
LLSVGFGRVLFRLFHSVPFHSDFLDATFPLVTEDHINPPSIPPNSAAYSVPFWAASIAFAFRED